MVTSSKEKDWPQVEIDGDCTMHIEREADRRQVERYGHWSPQAERKADLRLRYVEANSDRKRG